MTQYFFANGNEQRGPYTLDEIAALGLRPDVLVWHEGLTEWQRADSIPELVAKAIELARAQPQQQPAVAQPNFAPTQLNYQVQRGVPTDGMAVASLVLGLIAVPGLCAYGLGMIPAILAIIFGFLSRSRIRRGETAGAGIALAGLILGFIAAGLVVAFFAVAIAIGLIAAMK